MSFNLIEIDKGPDERFKQGFTGTCAASRQNENKTPVPWLTLPGGWAGSLKEVRGGMGWWVKLDV